MKSLLQQGGSAVDFAIRYEGWQHQERMSGSGGTGGRRRRWHCGVMVRCGGELIERNQRLRGSSEVRSSWRASSYAAPIRWGNQCWLSCGKRWSVTQKKTSMRHRHPFLTSFAKCAFCKGLQVFQLAANILQHLLRRQIAERESPDSGGLR